MAIEFDQPVVAGTVLVREDIRSQNYVQGSAGWRIEADGDAEFNFATIRGGTVVGGTALYYSGTPGPGTLIMSISAAAGTDSYGNTYVAGVGVYGTSDAVTVRASSGDTAVLTADAPSGIADPTGPGLVLKKASGDAEGASLTEFDSTFERGIYLRAPSPVADPFAAQGGDFSAMEMTGRYHGVDPIIRLRAGDTGLAPDGGIWLNDSFVDASGEVTVYGSGWHTYNPTITGSGGAAFSRREGWWQRLGGWIFVNIHLDVLAAGAGATAISVQAPTEIDRTHRQVLTAQLDQITAGKQGVGYAWSFTTGITAGFFERVRDRANAAITGADLLAGASIVIQGIYREG